MDLHLRRVMTALLVVAAVTALAVPVEVWARAGGGGSLGSRGSRSYSSPSRTYRSPSAPPTSSPSPSTRSAPTPLSQPSPVGGFWRSMAGGILGGILGGMLFRGMGFAGDGGFGGGFGLFDLLLLGGIGYLIYRMVRRRQPVEELATGSYHAVSPEAYEVGAAATVAEPPLLGPEDRERGLAHLRQMDPGFDEAGFVEWGTDTFFRIQAAWMRKDLDGLKPVLTEEMQDIFRKQLEEARAKGQMNRLENITVRSAVLTEMWQEKGLDYATVHFLANLLDYTVDEATGKVVSGSNLEPVKFEEFWTWVRPVGPNPWRLSAINQAE